MGIISPKPSSVPCAQTPTGCCGRFAPRVISFVPIAAIASFKKRARSKTFSGASPVAAAGTRVAWSPVWGSVEETQHYVMNKLQTEDGSMMGDDDIRPIDISKGKTVSDSLRKANDPAMKMIKEYEKQNSGKKKIKVRDGSTGGN